MGTRQLMNIAPGSVASFEGIVGRSRCMHELYRKVQLAAATDVTILISGESGTGKELVARAIHRRSARQRSAFIAINCGALAQDLVPSELFGHEKGAFTGAVDIRNGLFERANDGTLFLDEVSSMDYRTQTSLLRILENREYRRVGGGRTHKTNARIIAATNKDLFQAVQNGHFRKDLYYRLEVFTIALPPLRMRQDDLPLLIAEFVRMFNHELGKKITKISDESIEYLRAYDWPGNVRELKNIIQRAIILSGGQALTADLLPDRMLKGKAKRQPLTMDMGLTLKEIEKRYIERTLQWLGGNKLKASQVLGISRRALYNKIQELPSTLGLCEKLKVLKI